MANIPYISLFLVCIFSCTGVSLILRRFCYTVSPINQNIIRKLSSFLVFLITPAIYFQVITKMTSTIRLQSVSVKELDHRHLNISRELQ